MNTLKFPVPERLSFAYGTFGSVSKTRYADFDRCIKAAMDAQIPFHGGEDMYICDGNSGRIICIITFQGVEYTEAGLQFLQAHKIR